MYINILYFPSLDVQWLSRRRRSFSIASFKAFRKNSVGLLRFVILVVGVLDGQTPDVEIIADGRYDIDLCVAGQLCVIS